MQDGEEHPQKRAHGQRAEQRPVARRTRQGIAAIPAAPLASRVLALLWAHGNAQALVERLINSASVALANNKETIRKKGALTMRASTFKKAIDPNQGGGGGGGRDKENRGRSQRNRRGGQQNRQNRNKSGGGGGGGQRKSQPKGDPVEELLDLVE